MNTIHNARITLLATALNNIGVGAILAGIIAPTVNGTLGGIGYVGAWLVIGCHAIITAQLLLGRLRIA